MEIRRIIQKRSKGFSMIEMIAACVMVSILVPGISLIVRGTMMNIAFTNMAVFANMEADYAQRKFIKHINGVESFSEGNLTVNNLRFTSYLNGAVYEYTIDNTLPKSSSSRTIKYSKDSGTAGILLQKVVKDTTIDAVNYVSKFTYKDRNNNNLSVPVASYTGTNVAFNSGAKSIAVPSGNSFADFVAGNIITISGSTSNNGTFTIASLTDDNTIVVSESITTEGSGDTITVSIEVHGVELTFYLLRGESFYKYTTYATIDEDQLDI